ncbi:hypothetical protein PlfCFBP13513_08620 [Plantibacter flavus]|uniref:protein phosphatase 2C domain-containing protein n=1 Tax=Plantibacter flavus TaxID=150123 RepID=UPI0010C228E3|nr:protein phosphatase 2C domain-containing protein [Plantibacter flavus]TKJ99431.1 hypothetical protein PlfCFBP13513_08620 [Plantibacter flavus]
MPRHEPQAGGSRPPRPAGPIARLFGRAHSIGTATVLPGASAPSHPASIQADFGTLLGGAAEIRAASVRGLSHRSEGASLRQDTYAWASDKRNVYFAVADGVGSAEYSHIGARIAVTAAIALLSAGLRNHRHIGAAIAAQMAAEARLLGVDQSALATTLVAVVVRASDGSLPWRVAVAEWGDSRAQVFTPRVAVDGHPAWRHITEGEERFYTNEVAALPSYPNAGAVGLATLSPGEVLLLSSDGIDAHLLPDNHVGHGLAASWSAPPSIAQFIADVDFERVGARDDRTALALFRPEPVSELGNSAAKGAGR